MTNEEKQLFISGFLGDGYIKENGTIRFTCVHQEYIDYKKSLISSVTFSTNRVLNKGYKKNSYISRLIINVSDFGKDFYNLPDNKKIKDINELGLALWFYDDGSRHKKHNFYNINTHAFSEDFEKNCLIPLLNKFNIFPEIYTETKKDGRIFSYLYISKWRGAMEMSRIMRKFSVPCYDYKLVPLEIENAYFDIKDNEDFLNASTTRKTNIIKEYLKVSHSDNLSNNFSTPEYINSDYL